MKFEDLPQWRKDRYKEGVVQLWTRGLFSLAFLYIMALGFARHDSFIKKLDLFDHYITFFLNVITVMIIIHGLAKGWVWLSLRFQDSVD